MGPCVTLWAPLLLLLPHIPVSDYWLFHPIVSISFFLLNMSIPVLNQSSSSFFEVEGRRYDTNNRLVPAARSISQLSSESCLMPANRVVARASALGSLCNGWGLGGISPVHPSIFVAHIVEFGVGLKMMLGKLESYGRVGKARGVGKDFVLYTFLEESARADQHPISCLVISYDNFQNTIPICLRLRYFFFRRSLPSIWEFKVPYPTPSRGSVSIPSVVPAVSTSSHVLTSSTSILAGHSEVTDVVGIPAEAEEGINEVDVGEVQMDLIEEGEP